LIALDAKMIFDDNAMYRHESLKAYFDPNEEDPQDLEAAKWNLNYIRLDGNIGCMVNGAGLAMATMDIIKFSGGSPANFLDVGGGASAETWFAKRSRFCMGDKNVKCIFVNIFGGILQMRRARSRYRGRCETNWFDASTCGSHGRYQR
jgi:succinyl-CoA synthetase beta subunit